MPLGERSASLAEVLDALTTEAAEELTDRLGGRDLRCHACGHRCLIREGKRGICKVRFNDRGRLLVPTNYVAALACDPTEKKPFFHLLPGSDTLTFGMLGCDLHCAYCFTGDTVVVTDRGPATFAELFGRAGRVERRPDAEVAFPEGLRAVTASGALRRVRGVFKHHYRGGLTVIRPYYLPALRCTPDHRVYATADPNVTPAPTHARHLTSAHFLAVPRRHGFSSPQTVDVARAFLDAYVAGDGHRYPNGKVSVTTVSPRLAYGVAWLALKLGHLPSIYDAAVAEDGLIQNRPVKRPPHQYTVVWYEGGTHARRVVETEDFYLVPLREVSSEHYEGDVYNMEVEKEHNYLAGFFAVSNCQNWVTSQSLRDDAAGASPRRVSSEGLVRAARECGARVVGSSYNEPLITAEWAVEVFGKAKAEGLRTAFISNGNATPRVLDYLRPVTDCYKIDLKSMSDRAYRQLGGVVDNILDTVRMVHERGFWEEVVTLVVPGFNDSEDELKRAADFIASVSPDIPWHLTAFHQDYRMTENANTTAEQLVRACELGRAAGLRFVYAGNLPGRVGRWENTYCPACDELLVERRGYRIQRMRLGADGLCPSCKEKIPGVWG
jgi:pyruvate formate lyase activating enzyme